jgi:hypothetical protein
MSRLPLDTGLKLHQEYVTEDMFELCSYTLQAASSDSREERFLCYGLVQNHVSTIARHWFISFIVMLAKPLNTSLEVLSSMLTAKPLRAKSREERFQDASSDLQWVIVAFAKRTHLLT